MAYDAAATTAFAAAPAVFLRANTVQTHANALTGITLTRPSGAPATPIPGPLTPYHALGISDSALNTITAIAPRPQPTAAMGLFTATNSGLLATTAAESAPNRYMAHLQANIDGQHPTLVYYLPAVASKIARLAIPTDATGPTLILTPALTGCTIFVSASSTQSYLYHANAWSVAPERIPVGRAIESLHPVDAVVPRPASLTATTTTSATSTATDVDDPAWGGGVDEAGGWGGNPESRSRYMRDLLRAFLLTSTQRATHMLDKAMYEHERLRLAGRLVAAERHRGRAFGHWMTHYGEVTNVFGISDGHPLGFLISDGDILDERVRRAEGAGHLRLVTGAQHRDAADARVAVDRAADAVANA